MDCNRCGEQLTAFLDGELSNSDSEQVKSHISTCVSCSEELRSLQEVGEFIESHNRNLEPRPGSWNMVRARIHQESPAPAPRGWIFNRWRLALGALALLAASAIGYIQYEQIQQRNLDKYISGYVQQREANANELNISKTGGPYSDNPFIEVKATLDENPFRSEDR